MVVRYYPYEEFVKDVKVLLPKIGEFDTYLAVSRGGLTLAHFLAEAKRVRNVTSVNVISYEEMQHTGVVRIFGLPDLSRSKRVLVIEDIVDSGATLTALMQKLKKTYPAVEFKTLALFYKKSASFKPDFFVQYANEWIEFFWTKDIQ